MNQHPKVLHPHHQGGAAADAGSAPGAQGIGWLGYEAACPWLQQPLWHEAEATTTTLSVSAPSGDAMDGSA